ncbi:hypothetical protein CAPTEDRAFT_191653 [Capitella teleta]|uniref:G-protein coupled receptors family 1 profile domain-containing protein n=1 Tax=Capitella teleta TaxID=283909 RepID=R7TDF7_CAPTE|nr:hypothetical protein CAPTEDRAFT_191653 [Capitella teleta]|eukprot:ELT91763.1 hypothetical protein CAPTEDRAFT_191653 [Capitella teleta]
MALTSEPTTWPWDLSTNTYKGESSNSSNVCTYYKFSISVVLMGSLCIFGIAAFLVLKVSISFCAFNNTCPGYYSPYFWISFYGWPTLSMIHCLANWVTVLLTVHRYIAVCHPLKAKAWTTTSSLKYQIPPVILAAVCYSIPGYIDYEPVQVMTEWGLTNQLTLTPIGANYWYQLLYKTVCFFVFIYFIPGITLLVLGGFLIQSITRAERIRSSMSRDKKMRSSSATDDMTRIMISIVVMHLMTQSWEPLRSLMAERFQMSATCGNFLFYFEEIPSLMAIINSTMNFVVYCFVGTRFRKACKQLVCARGDQPSTTANESSSQ